MHVCMREASAYDSTPSLNWVVGNKLLWQLLFAGPGAKRHFSFPAYTVSLSLSVLFSVLPRSLRVSLQLLLLFPCAALSLYRSLALRLPLRSPLSYTPSFLLTRS